MNSPGSACLAPERDEGRDDRSGNEQSAVRRDLDHIFAGKGVRTGKDGHQSLIESVRRSWCTVAELRRSRLGAPRLDVPGGDRECVEAHSVE